MLYLLCTNSFLRLTHEWINILKNGFQIRNQHEKIRRIVFYFSKKVYTFPIFDKKGKFGEYLKNFCVPPPQYFS